MESEHSLGARIREARDRKGWTQQQLASALGVNKKTVNNWENDRVSAPRRSLVLLEDVLAPWFRAASPARRTAAAMTDDQRAEVMQELLRLTQALADDDAIRLELDQPEDKPPERSRRAG